MDEGVDPFEDLGEPLDDGGSGPLGNGVNKPSDLLEGDPLDGKLDAGDPVDGKSLGDVLGDTFIDPLDGTLVDFPLTMH